MNHTTFSIIIPTYNRSYVLWKAILSVQQQYYTNWELIIADDGSTDETKKLIAEFQDDHRIKYLQQQNQGPSAARNLGLSNASGDVICYLDSDDELYPQYLSVVSQALLNQPTKNYGLCNHNRCHELLDTDFKTMAQKFDGKSQHEEITLEDIYNWDIKTTATGLFHRREKFIHSAKWTAGIYIEDLEFLMQLALQDESGFLHIPQTLFNYKQKYGGDGLCSQASNDMWAHSFGTIYELHKNDPLMQKPEVYLQRVDKYRELSALEREGKVPPQMYKYFPELYS